MALNAVTLCDADQFALIQQLIAMLLPISPVRTDDLLGLARSLPFRDEYVLTLEAKINALKQGGSALWQDWSSIYMYISDELARAWSDQNMSLHMLIWQLLLLADKMGLQKPSQQTFQSLTTIMLILRNGTNWTPVEKKKLFDQVKQEFKRYAAQGRAAGNIFIANLPTPHQLHELIPSQWWTQVFGKPFENISWVATESQLFDRIAASIPMRNTRTDVRETLMLAPSLNHSPMMMMAMQAAASSGGFPGFALQGARAGGLAGALTDASINLMPRAGPDASPGASQLAGPAASHGALQPALRVLMNTAEPCAHGPADSPGAPAEDAALNTAADTRKSCMSLQEVTEALGLHAQGMMKRPAAAKKPKPAAASVQRKPAAAKADFSKARRDNGCPKCRGKPGCTPSCIRFNTRPY